MGCGKLRNQSVIMLPLLPIGYEEKKWNLRIKFLSEILKVSKFLEINKAEIESRICT